MTPERPLYVACDGLRLAGGAFVPASPRGLVVLLHGIPSAVPPDPADEGYTGLARRFAAKGWAAVWADMRACRSSPGHFSIEGWVRDARSIVEAARALEGAEGLRVAVVGSSAGGAVAVQAVARGAPVDALVLLAAPAAWLSFAGSPAEAVRRITVEAGMALAPGVDGAPDRWAAEFETVVPEDAIGELSIPTLIVHGTADEVVPVDHAHRLAERAPGAELQVIEGAPHTLRRHPGVFELVESWIGGTLS